MTREFNNSEARQEPREIPQRARLVEDCTKTGELIRVLSQSGRNAVCVRSLRVSFANVSLGAIAIKFLTCSYLPARCSFVGDWYRKRFCFYMPREDYGDYCKHIKVSLARRKNDSACFRGRRWRRSRDILRREVGGYPQSGFRFATSVLSLLTTVLQHESEVQTIAQPAVR